MNVLTLCIPQMQIRQVTDSSCSYGEFYFILLNSSKEHLQGYKLGIITWCFQSHSHD